MHAIRKLQFERAKADEKIQPPPSTCKARCRAGVETDGRHWHIKKIEKGEVKLVGGGDVVGKIPSGLPGLPPAAPVPGRHAVPAVGGLHHRPGGLHGVHLHGQGPGGPDQAAPGPEPGTHRPGPGQYRRRLLPVLPGLRLLHRLGHQPAGRGQDRLRHGVQRTVRGGHPAVPDRLPLPPAQGHTGGDHPVGGHQPDHAQGA
jgi:hypothetical protein